MQAYFDNQDAELELEAFVTKSHSKADTYPGEQVQGFAGRQLWDIVGLSVVIGMAVVLMAAHLGSAMPAKILKVPKKRISETSFVIEIPPEEKPKPKPKPKIQPPKPEVVERLRSIPDSRLSEVKRVIKPEKRKTSTDKNRSAAEESIGKRAMPAVRTPIVADKSEALQRNETAEALRYAYVSDFADTIGGFVNIASGTDSRNLPEENISHVKLDPYHYRMVNVCLRLCVKSMFTHSGMSKAERQSSDEWLRVERGGDEHFSCLGEGRWLRFDINSDHIGDISNLSFVEIPSRISADDVNLLLEEVTRRLCRLLGYDDCFEQL